VLPQHAPQRPRVLAVSLHRGARDCLGSTAMRERHADSFAEVRSSQLIRFRAEKILFRRKSAHHAATGPAIRVAAHRSLPFVSDPTT